jgi:LCP family protein required for cell wall assembly
MNSFSYSYDSSSRILSIKDSTGKTVFVPKTLDGTPENWKEETKDGRTLISYTVGGETIQHTIQGKEYRTLIGSNTVPHDFRACWEKEFKDGKFQDAQICRPEDFNVVPSTPPSKPSTTPPSTPPAPVPVVPNPSTPSTPPAPPASGKPNPTTPSTTPSPVPVIPNPSTPSTPPAPVPVVPNPSTENLTPSEKAAAQRAKEEAAKKANGVSEVYGPPSPTAADFNNKPIPAPSSTPATTTTGNPKVEVGKSFPSNLPAGVTPYHYEKEKNPDGTYTLRLKQGDKTLYTRPLSAESKEDPLNNPEYKYEAGFKDGSSLVLTNIGDGKLRSRVIIDPRERNLFGNPVVSVEEQKVLNTNEYGVETLAPTTFKKTDPFGSEIKVTQTAKETELKELNEKILTPKQNLLQWQEKLRQAEAETPQDPNKIAKLKQEVAWARGPYDALVAKRKELEAAIEAEKKGITTPTPSTTKPPASQPWWNPLPTPTEPVLVMGVDNTGNPKDPFKGGHTDTMMLMRPDKAEGDIDLVSLPRDTRVQSGGKTEKLNASYAQGGAGRTLQTVQNSLGVPVDKYVAFDTKIVRDIVDAIGGVEVVIKEPLKYEDKTAGLKIDIPAGDPNNGYKVRLDGKNAEHYLRYRADGNGDIGRIPRQQAFIKAAWEQLISPSVLTKIPSILQAVNNKLDTNMTYPELLQYLASASQVNPSEVDISTLKGTPSTGGGPSYWIPDANQPALEPFKKP